MNVNGTIKSTNKWNVLAAQHYHRVLLHFSPAHRRTAPSLA